MYNSYFGFLESPFSVTPDPRFFYTNPIYQEAYATLRYGIEAKKGFIVDYRGGGHRKNHPAA